MGMLVNKQSKVKTHCLCSLATIPSKYQCTGGTGSDMRGYGLHFELAKKVNISKNVLLNYEIIYVRLKVQIFIWNVCQFQINQLDSFQES